MACYSRQGRSFLELVCFLNTRNMKSAVHGMCKNQKIVSRNTKVGQRLFFPDDTLQSLEISPSHNLVQHSLKWQGEIYHCRSMVQKAWPRTSSLIACMYSSWGFQWFPSSYRCGLWVPAQSQYLVPPGQAECGAKGPSGESATRRSPRSPEPELNLLEGSGMCAWRRKISISRMHAGAATRCGA